MGHTQYVASIIKNAPDADIFRLETAVPYKYLGYKNQTEIAKKEALDDARPPM